MLGIIWCNIIKCFDEFKLLLKSLMQKYIILIINLYFKKGLVTCNIVNSLINVLLQFTAFDAFLPCYFILSFELNKAFVDIASKNALHFKVYFI